ncbi:copper amine oxidase N-terminal domain-containing protein [Wukongibacter baidiensis]
MKKILFILVILIGLPSLALAQVNRPEIILNGSKVEYTDLTGYPFLTENRIIMVPIVETLRSMGSTVDYDSSSKLVHVVKGDNRVLIFVDKNYIEYDGRKVYLDTTIKLTNGRIYGPIKDISELLGYQTIQDLENSKLEIFYEGYRNGLVEDSKDIPLNAFKVSYFETTNPSHIVATEIVESISLNINDDFHGISPSNFSAKWIGKFEFEEDTEKEIKIAESWSSTKLKINGEPVKPRKYTFKKGINLIEVEHTNNYHTIDFMLSFNDPSLIYSNDEAKEVLSKVIDVNTDIDYVSVYESTDMKHEINLGVTSRSNSVAIFLSSYGPVNWKINNPFNVDIKAIVYNSYEDGTTITLPKESKAITFRLPYIKHASSLFPTYDKIGHNYSFDNLEIKDVRNLIVEVTGKEMSGFTGVYGSSELQTPDIIMNEEKYAKIDEAFEEVERLKNSEPEKPSNLFGKINNEPIKTWGNYLNTKIEVPKNKFKGYFINTKDPRTVVKISEFDEAGVNYSWSDIGIESEDFGAYYVGDFNYDEEITKIIAVDQSYSFTRVIIDGKVVINDDGSYNGPVEYKFTRGTHRIEVEYVNDWHTTNFLVSIRDKVPMKTLEDARKFIGDNITSSTKVYMLDIYSSNQMDFKETLKLTDNEESALLILRSYEPIKWTIKDLKKTNLKGIIYMSYSEGSKIDFENITPVDYIRIPVFSLDFDYPSNQIKELDRKSSQYREMIGMMEELGLNRIDGLTIFKYSDSDFIQVPQYKFID